MTSFLYLITPPCILNSPFVYNNIDPDSPPVRLSIKDECGTPTDDQSCAYHLTCSFAFNPEPNQDGLNQIDEN